MGDDQSLLITNLNIEDFVKKTYGIPDAVLCIWATPTPPKEEETECGFVYSVDDAFIFIKEDVETLFFPKGIKKNEWNMVLACLKSKDKPILGWLMGTSLETLFSEDAWYEDYTVIG